MPVSAWLMLVFGVVVLYGGFAACVVLAVRSRPSPEVDADPVGEPEEEADDGA